METKFIQTMQQLEQVIYLLSEMNCSIEELITRIDVIYAYLQEYENLETLLEHFKELTSQQYLLKKTLTTDEAIKYIGIAPYHFYDILKNRDISCYRPLINVTYIPRMELEELKRSSRLPSKHDKFNLLFNKYNRE